MQRALVPILAALLASCGAVLASSASDAVRDQLLAVGVAPVGPRGTCQDPSTDMVGVDIAQSDETITLATRVVRSSARNIECEGALLARMGRHFQVTLDTEGFSFIAGYLPDTPEYGCNGASIVFYRGGSAPAPGCSVSYADDALTFSFDSHGTSWGKSYDFRGKLASSTSRSTSALSFSTYVVDDAIGPTVRFEP